MAGLRYMTTTMTHGLISVIKMTCPIVLLDHTIKNWFYGLKGFRDIVYTASIARW